MSAEVYVPENRQGWWGGADKRPRCTVCDKVSFDSEERAERSAEKIRARGEPMFAYCGKTCGNWHVGHSRRRRG